MRYLLPTDSLARLASLSLACWYCSSFLARNVSGQYQWLLAGLGCQIAIQLASGGVGAVRQEVAAVWADLRAPFALAVRSGMEPGKRAEEVLTALCCVSAYTYAYGPVSPLMFIAVVNSLCHGQAGHGEAAQCGARDISLLSILSCGDSFHATHHERSHIARHAPEGQLDMSYNVMRAAAATGLVHSLKRPGSIASNE